MISENAILIMWTGVMLGFLVVHFGLNRVCCELRRIRGKIK
ncbi:unnamed protein product [marine sediment metagenome]|uniref:Uncharacterized protein n=1 Tax=marine sediment metagenome TaxID=412755 RepID=X1KGU4_9ZZZZ